MKRNNQFKIFFLLLSTSFFIAGCKKDLLETVPTDRISTDIYWKTEKDATLASNAVYTYLGNAERYFYLDGISDLGHTNAPSSSESLILKGQYDPLNTRVQDEWTNAYAGIRSANTFMANVDQVQAIDATLIPRLKAEVRTLRAYYYSRLVGLYGDVPLITTEITLEESKELSRTPASQVYDFIKTELTEAAAALPTTQKDKGRVTKGAALAFLSRAMLWAGRYTDAIAASKAVMDLNVYSLYTSYEKLFTYAAENNSEVIFDIQYVKDTYSNNVFWLMAPFSQQNSQNRYVPTKKMVDAYPMTNGKLISDPTSGYDSKNPYANRDPRLKYSVFLPNDILPDGKVFKPQPGSGTTDAVGSSFQSSNTGFVIKKYINKEDLAQITNGGINLILIRYAEVLLNYAEAKVEAGQVDQSVLDAINALRKRADVNMPLVTTTDPAELRSIIRNERVVELAYEGLRMFDIRRWKIAETVVPGKIQGLTYTDAAGNVKVVEVQAWANTFDKSKHYLYPVPQKERDLNPNLSQNSNW
jgi:starch-binding outer membrane protein, SusD/RagB family